MPEAKKEVVPKSKANHHSYGWVPDLPDHRDYLYWAVRHAPAAFPTRVDLRNNCSKVEDQEVLGSCTANALAGALEYLEKNDKVPCTDLSRNSWGEQWGMKGYFTMPYAYVADRDLSDDFWTIRRGEKM